MHLILEQQGEGLEAGLSHFSSYPADASADESGQHVSADDGSAVVHGGQVPAEEVAQALEGEEDNGGVRVLSDAPGSF